MTENSSLFGSRRAADILRSAPAPTARGPSCENKPTATISTSPRPPSGESRIKWNQLTWFPRFGPALICLGLTAPLLPAYSDPSHLAASVRPASTSVWSSRAPAATIDINSLTSRSGNPTISGSARNVSSLSIFIYSDDLAHTYDFGVYGPYPGTTAVRNGHWQYRLGTSEFSGATSLPPGVYTVQVRQNTGVMPSGGQGLAGLLSGQELATGKLVVREEHRSDGDRLIL